MEILLNIVAKRFSILYVFAKMTVYCCQLLKNFTSTFLSVLVLQNKQKIRQVLCIN